MLTYKIFAWYHIDSHIWRCSPGLQLAQRLQRQKGLRRRSDRYMREAAWGQGIGRVRGEGGGRGY